VKFVVTAGPTREPLDGGGPAKVSPDHGRGTDPEQQADHCVIGLRPEDSLESRAPLNLDVVIALSLVILSAAKNLAIASMLPLERALPDYLRGPSLRSG
jgi:hypothetical protein